MALKKGDARLQPGLFNSPVTFYNMVETTGVGGQVIRTPVLAYTAFANVQPFSSLEAREAERVIGEIWAIISIQYFRSRLPIEGMTVVIKSSGETFEVRGVEQIDYDYRKVELTCRLVR